MLKRKIIFLAVIFALFTFLALSVNAHAEEFKYVGAKKCKMCHKKQYKSWKKTSMPYAFDLLKSGARAKAKKAAGLDPTTDYTGDAKCLKCHTTGYGKPGGFISFSKTPKMVGIQCESCHGPGKKYSKLMMKNPDFKLSKAKSLGLIVTDEATCRGCHNKSSPFFKEFNYEERVKKGTHTHYKLKRKHGD